MACLAAPLVLWVPESLPACAGLWRPVGTDWMPLYKRLETSMPGGQRLRCPDVQRWLAGWLAGLAGWLGWLAAAGGLLLAGCCWLAAAGWLKVVSHARRSGEVGGFYIIDAEGYGFLWSF